MKIKKLQLLVFTLVVFAFVSCNKEPIEILPGDWNTADGGTISFSSDGTGSTFNSDYFNFDCGTLNGVMKGPYPDFDWEVVEDDGKVLKMYFSHEDADITCSSTLSFPIKIKSKNKIKLGADAILIDLSMEITRQ